MPKRRIGDHALPNESQLRLFVTESDRLNEHKLVQSGFSPKLNISMDGPDQPWQYRIQEPDKEILESYLIYLRKFMMSGEPVFIHRVRSLARQHLTDDSLKQELDNAHLAWKAHSRNREVEIILNERQVLPDYAWDLYINGVYFHLDLEKRGELEQFADPELLWMIRWQFLSQIVHATEYVFEVSETIERGFRHTAFNFSEETP